MPPNPAPSSGLPSGPPGNAASLGILSRRPGGGGYEGIPSGASSGGPDDMVRQAIMEHLRYMLAPDRSAAPMSRAALQEMGADAEYPSLDYETALSNPRAADAIAPLMALYGQMDQRGQQARQFESQMADAEARRAYTGAQARNLNNGGKIRPEIMKAATLVYNARKWVDTEILKAERDASNGIDINIGGKPIKAAEAPAIIAAIRKNVQDANDLLDLANQATESGDIRTGNYYAYQAATMLSQYEPLMKNTPAPGVDVEQPVPVTNGADLAARIKAMSARR